MTRRELKILLRDYPDVVSLPELCTMMGGIGDSTAMAMAARSRSVAACLSPMLFSLSISSFTMTLCLDMEVL